MPINFHEIPKLRDSLSYFYVEHAIIDRKENSVEILQKDGRTMLPVAALCILMLGPGTSITHAAMKVIAENGCSVLWCGEEVTRCYAFGLGETRKAYHLLRQAAMVCDPQSHQRVVVNMYRYRLGEQFSPDLPLSHLRGMEGARVKAAYAQAAQQNGIKWSGRQYNRDTWEAADPVNRALSAANALLNGICHAAIVSGGYSPALGFIHTGRQLSFVYDIAALYKTELTVPAAFETVAESSANVEKRVRTLCRERFRQARLLSRILPDIDGLLEIEEPSEEAIGVDPPSDLWEELM